MNRVEWNCFISFNSPQLSLGSTVPRECERWIAVKCAKLTRLPLQAIQLDTSCLTHYTIHRVHCPNIIFWISTTENNKMQPVMYIHHWIKVAGKHCPKYNLNIICTKNQIKEFMSGIWSHTQLAQKPDRYCTVLRNASFPTLTGLAFMQRFRLFLGQCLQIRAICRQGQARGSSR